MKRRQAALLAAVLSSSLYLALVAAPARAEDCVGVVPGNNCTLDENTTAPLELNLGDVLTVSAGFLAQPLEINHTILGDTAIGKGEIDTAGNGGIIYQQEDIGAVPGFELTGLTINAGDIWYVSGGADLVLDFLGTVQINGGVFGVAPGSGSSFIGAQIFGGAGNDIVDFISGGQSFGTTGTLGRPGEIINMGDGDDRIMYHQEGASQIDVDRILMGDGNNLFGILGASATSVFEGTFVGSINEDTVAFFSGSSAILGSSASLYFFGAGEDLLDFDSGSGFSDATMEARTLDMGNDADFVNLTDSASLTVNTTFNAGLGNDLVSFTSGGYFDARGALFTMGGGDDVLRFNSVGFVAGSSGLHITGGTFTMGDGNDSIIFVSNAVGIEGPGTTVNLGIGNDSIIFQSSYGTIRFQSGSGLFNIDGGADTDTIVFGSGATVLFGDQNGGGAISNLENIDLGGGAMEFYGTIDGTATVFNFTSAEFLGPLTVINATILGDAGDNFLSFSSGAAFTSGANMGAGSDRVAFASGAVLQGTVDLDADNDNLDVISTAIISGTADGGAGADTLTFIDGTSIITGDIINFESALVTAGATVNIRAGANILVDLAGTGTVQFGSAGSAAFTLTPTSDIDQVNLEIVGDTFDTGGFLLGATTALSSLSVNQGATLLVNDDIDASGGAFANDGRVRFAPDAQIIANSYDASDDGRFIFELNYDGVQTTIGQILLTGAGQDIDFSSATGSGSIFQFVFAPGTLPLVTDSLSFISAGAGGQATGPEAANIIGSNILYTYAVGDTNGDNQDLEFTVTQQSTVNGLADTNNNRVIGNVLFVDLLGAQDPGIIALQDGILASANAAEFNAGLSAALPIVDGSEVVGIRNINTKTFGLINQRLAMLRGDESEDTGISSGEIVEELEAWWEFFAMNGEQDHRGEVDGYNATTYGMAGGLDKELFEDAFFGLSFAWGDTSANSKGPGNSDTNVDSYQLSAYADYDFGGAYLNGMVSYGYNDIYTAKTSAAGERTASFHASSYSARGEVGYAFMPGKTRIIPYLMSHYTYYSPESYTEEGPAAQQITGDSLRIFEVGTGVDLNWLIKNGEGSYFVPQVKLGYRYDLAKEPVIATTRFLAGGPVFEIQGAEPAEQTIDLDLGITYFSKEDWELLFRYDIEWKEDYMSHAGMVRAAYKFY